MLLVHDDKPQLAGRSEDGTSWTDDHRRLALPDPVVILVSQGRTKRAVHYHDPGKSLNKTGKRL